MSDERGFTTQEIIGLLPGGWALADQADPGAWDDAGHEWRTRLIDGADVPRELVVGAATMAQDGRIEALRSELERVYRRVCRRGLFG